jgi:branched-subunit amino acid transport protein
VGASVACYLLKLAGLSVPQRWLVRPRVRRVAALMPVALLAALVALQTVTDGRALVLDARLPGVLVAVVAQWRRAPFAVVVLSACATTAAVRAIG